jgi:CRP-like cAMP-binding protein
MEQLKAVIKQLIHLNAEEWQALAALFHVEKWEKKSYFAQEDSYARQFAFIQSGALRAFYRNQKGEEYNKTFFTAQHFVGAFSSLISKDSNLINIQCLTPCQLLVSDYTAFTNLYEQYPKIERISRLLAEQFFIQKEKREIELVMLDAKARYSIFQQEHPNLEQLIPQYHIASYLGVSATQLSRIRAKRKK